MALPKSSKEIFCKKRNLKKTQAMAQRKFLIALDFERIIIFLSLFKLRTFVKH